MPFELPTEFAPRTKNKPLSENSVKVYRTRLNKLAQLELGNNPAEIKKNHKKVIKFLQEMGTSEKDKTLQRNYLSAIFWVMDAKYKSSKRNPFYKYYQQVLPAMNNLNGDAWKPRTQFTTEHYTTQTTE